MSGNFRRYAERCSGKTFVGSDFAGVENRLLFSRRADLQLLTSHVPPDQRVSFLPWLEFFPCRNDPPLYFASLMTPAGL